MGGGKGSSTTQVQVTPEQQRLLQAQTDFLTGTAFPAYSSTVGGAKNAYNQTAGQAINAANNAMNVSSAAGALQGSVGTGAYQSGVGGTSDVTKYQQALGQGLTAGAVGQLASLFGPEYEQQQIQAALQPATEQVREEMNQQGALFGGAGGLGSARQALASQNLASLSQARLGNIAAQTAANVAGQRQQVGQALLGAGQGATSAAQQGFGSLASLGQQGLSAAQQSAAANIGYAQTPQDIYSKYASVVFGVPQGNTTPNFAGTQGQSTSGKSMGFKL